MKKHLFLAASAALALASCSSETDFTQESLKAQNEGPTAVEFGTYLGKAGTTRAYSKGPITNDNLKEAEFGVFAYLTTGDYAPATVTTSPSNIAPDFMYNQQIKWSTGTPAAWVYSPVKYWPNGIDAANATNPPSNSAVQDETYAKKLSFFAYAPYITTPTETYSGTAPTGITVGTDVKTNSATNGINAMTTNTFTGNVWVKYLMPNANEDDAVDLLWGLRGDYQYTETDGSNNPNDAPAPTTLTGNDYNINLTKQTVGEKVKFLFKHALAKIEGSTETGTGTDKLNEPSTKCGFSIKLDVDGNDGDNQSTYFGSGSNFDKAKTLVTVKSVKIQDGATASSDTSNGLTGITTSNIKKSGWFNIETGTWDFTGAEEGATINITVQNDKDANDPSNNKYTLNPEIRENSADPAVKNAAGVDWDFSKASTEDGYTGGAKGVEVAAKPLFANEDIPGVLFIPGGTQELYITVEYVVRTADSNLSTGFSEVTQMITNKVSFASLKPNKIYKIVMHLGLTSVKFEAKVADWQTKTGGTYSESGTYSPGGDDNETTVWLPSNVVDS